jgi:hypothetical protein
MDSGIVRLRPAGDGGTPRNDNGYSTVLTTLDVGFWLTVGSF